MLLLALVIAAGSLPAETYTVTKEADDNGACEVDDCALREALLAANSRPGPDVVLLPAGTYRIEISEPLDFEDSGSFDIRDDRELVGEPGAELVGNGLHRVLFISACTAMLSDLVIRGGVGDGNGGGVRTSIADVTIVNSTIRENWTNLNGAGIGVNGGSLTLIGSTVVGNEAAFNGGGLYRFGVTGFPGGVRILNSTFSGNRARQGGGIGFVGFGTFSASNLTLANNTVSFRSSAFFADRTSVTQPVTFTNTLIAGECGLAQIPTSRGGNIESPGATCFLQHPSDRMNVADAGLGPLDANGGPTLTHALLPGSPAIDTGVAEECEELDQRGVRRPLDGDVDGAAGCDVGAYELRPFTFALEIPSLAPGWLALLALTLASIGLRRLRGGREGIHQRPSPAAPTQADETEVGM